MLVEFDTTNGMKEIFPLFLVLILSELEKLVTFTKGIPESEDFAI